MLLDASSTVQELCKLIVKGDKKKITIVTNSFNVVSICKSNSNISVIHIGGILERELDSSIGSISENILRNIRVDKVFLGVNGIHSNFGYSITNLQEAAVKTEMIKCARQVFVIADHTKFGDTYLAKIADFKNVVDYLITDTRIKNFDYSLYEENTNLIIADEDKEF